MVMLPVGVSDVEEVIQESNVAPSFIETLLRRKRDYMSVKRIVAYVLRFVGIIQPSLSKATDNLSSLPSASEMRFAEDKIILGTQRRHFSKEVEALAKADPKKIKRVLNRSGSALRQLDPFVDNKSFLRVGGRLNLCEEAWEVKHPLILPQSDPLVNHLIFACHVDNGHAGIEFVLSEIRRRFWILRGRSAVKKVIWRCLDCRRRHGRPEAQQMAPLPPYRLNVAPPFEDSGVDLFGPIQVKSGRYTKKVWVVLFCCLRIRAVHLEVVKDLETDTFIDALQRFHAFYPSLKRLVSDQGTNLIGANNLLHSMVAEWKTALCRGHPSGIDWKFIPPHAPHQGGIWERLVTVVKKTIAGIPQAQDMDIERFRTVVCIAAGIVNRRPLTRFSSDPRDLHPLTLAHFLNPSLVSVIPSSDVLPSAPLTGSELRRSKDILRPLIDSFWKQWTSQYVANLQKRSKWISRRRNIKSGDLVLLVDEAQPRGQWPLAVVMDTVPSVDGLVRRVTLRTSSNQSLERDIRKVVLLEREGDDDDSVEEEIVDGGGDD